MSEGEFQKRCKGWSFEGNIKQLAEEAKKEYPLGTDSYTSLKKCRQINYERHVWFKKWFGDPTK